MAKNRFEILRDGGEEDPPETPTGGEGELTPGAGEGEGEPAGAPPEGAPGGEALPPKEEWFYESPNPGGSRYRTKEGMFDGTEEKDRFITQLKAENRALEEKLQSPPPVVPVAELGEPPDADLDPQGYLQYQMAKMRTDLEQKFDQRLKESNSEITYGVLMQSREDAFLNSPANKDKDGKPIYVRGNTLETSNQAYKELLSKIGREIGKVDDHYPLDCFHSAHILRTAQREQERFRLAVDKGRAEGAARVVKEIAGSQKRGGPTMPAGEGGGTAGLTPEQAAELTPEQWAKLPQEKRDRLLAGKT